MGALPPEDVREAPAPRNVYIRREVERRTYGYTEGCLGCLAACLKRPAVSHSTICRARITRCMQEDPAGAQRLAEAAARGAPAAPAEELPPAEEGDAGGAAPAEAAAEAARIVPSGVVRPRADDEDDEPPARRRRGATSEDLSELVEAAANDLNGVGLAAGSLDTLAASTADIVELFGPGTVTGPASTMGLVAGGA